MNKEKMGYKINKKYWNGEFGFSRIDLVIGLFYALIAMPLVIILVGNDMIWLNLFLFIILLALGFYQSLVKTKQRGERK